MQNVPFIALMIATVLVGIFGVSEAIRHSSPLVSSVRDAAIHNRIVLAGVAMSLQLQACEDRPVSAKAVTCDTEQMRPWILDCIERANPHADEEPEDNTKQCERTAIHLFCGPTCYLTLEGTIRCD